MNTCTYDLNRGYGESLAQRFGGWLKTTAHRHALQRNQRSTGRIVSNLSDQMIADIGLHEPATQLRVLGNEVEAIRKATRWQPSNLDFRMRTNR